MSSLDGTETADPADRGPGDYAAIHDAVARLAGVCDFAESLDGQGFSAVDTWLGHVLAAMPAASWTGDEALSAWDMLSKYRSQLRQFGISYGDLPKPPGASELPDTGHGRARVRARRRARDWRWEQYREQQSYVRCDGGGHDVILAFPYDADTVAAARKLTGRRWDPDTKTNVFPFTSLSQVAAFADARGISVTPEVRALIPAAAAEAEQEASRPDIYTDRAGQVIIRAGYNADLNQALKDLNGGRSTWDKAARVHRPPLRRDPARVLEIATRFGLTVGDDARRAIETEKARQERNRAAATAFEADPVPVPGLADGQALKLQQYPVVRFALEHRRVLVGDDMGWGKTLSSLAAVAADGAYPAVVVCRPSLTLNWAAEIRRFFPHLAVHEASGATPQPIPAGTEVVVIGSAALAAKPRKKGRDGPEFGWVEALKKITPKALIIDEGQDTKERTANRSQACEQLAGSVIARDGLVLDLTGTAIINRPRELCQQLAILGRISEFGGPKAFLWRYCLSETNDWGASYNGARNLTELHQRLLAWGIMIRRSDDAALGLPPCREHVLRIPGEELDPGVMVRYQQAEADLLGYLADQARTVAARLGKDPSHAAVAAAMRASAAEHLVAINTLRQLAGQAKRRYVTGWVRGQVQAGEKVMVAAHHRDEVDAYATRFGGLKLQGGQPVAEKEATKAAFQTSPAAQAPVIAVAIGAGGVGHTLTAARVGIQAEQAWTPGETQQMKKRLHRIGQDRPVDYYVTVAENTIDEQLWDVVTAKQATLNAVLDGKSDEGAADDEKSIAAELTWRLTRQGLGGDPGSPANRYRPGTPPGSAPAARRPPSGVSQAAGIAASQRTTETGPVGEPVTALLIVTGPREGVSKETVRAALQPRFAENILLVTGAAAGVDTYAAELWRAWGGRVEEHRLAAEEWDRDPRGAGYARNARMVKRVTTAGGAVLAIGLPCAKPGCARAQPHNTHGTSHCAAIAEQAGLPVEHYQAPRSATAAGPGASSDAGRHQRASAARPAGGTAKAGGDGDSAGAAPAGITRYTREAGPGHPLTVYAPRPGELDRATFAAFAAAETVLGLDVETSAVDDDGARQFDPGFTVRLVQFGSEREAWVLNLADPEQRDAAAAVFADPARRFVTHTPYDVLAVWSAFGIPLGQRVTDTHLLSKLVNPDERAGHGLKELSGRRLDDGLTRAEQALHARMQAAAPPGHQAGNAWLRWGWNHLPAGDEAYAVYAGLDAIYVRRLLPVLLGQCAPFAHLVPAESWLGAQATGITIRGLLVDRSYTRALLADLAATHRAANEAIVAALGCPGASPRFAAWLDEKAAAAGISGLPRTPTGQLQVTEASMTALLEQHAAALPAGVCGLVRHRLAMSQTANMVANLHAFLTTADPGGRVHPQINTLRAKTARMSVTHPALQTLKKHDPRLRRCFRADPGHVLISCDFSQVEIRVAAALSGDPALRQAILAGTDIHDATAALIYGPGFTEEQRTIAKRATFGAIYGGGAHALAAQTGASDDAAREVIGRWKAAYPGVTAYGQRLAAQQEITTGSGRRIPADPARPYASANYAIQSTARDLLLAAVYRLITQHRTAGLWLFVHDEVIVQAPERDAEHVREQLQHAMTGTFRGLPILAEAKILGPTWGDTSDPPPAPAARPARQPQQPAQDSQEPAQGALFGPEAAQATPAVTGLPAGRFDPAASGEALTGDGYQWLRAEVTAPTAPDCETCGQLMRLPADAPILWTCPRCHPEDTKAVTLPRAAATEQQTADPARATPRGQKPRPDDDGRVPTPGAGPAGPSVSVPRQNASEDERVQSARDRLRAQTLRGFAHQYLDHGLQPVPAWVAAENGECCCHRGADCPRPGKHPRSVRTGPGPGDYSWKPLACRTHEEIDKRFADEGPYAAANLMLAIPPGMMVIDQDNDEGGQQAVKDLADHLGELPETLSHQTPHGVHHIYRTPEAWRGRAWVGKDPRNPLPPGIDLRMPGQILMAAPSQVPGDDEPAQYGPVTGRRVASLPAPYLTAWTPAAGTRPQPSPRPAAVPPGSGDRVTSYVQQTMNGIVTDLASREPGTGRNTAIYTAALKAGSLLGAIRAARGADRAASTWTDETAETSLMEAAERNGYVGKDGAAEARSAIRSGLRNGLRNPRALPDFAAPAASTAPSRPGWQRARARASTTPPVPAAPGTEPAPEEQEANTPSSEQPTGNARHGSRAHATAEPDRGSPRARRWPRAEPAGPLGTPSGQDPARGPGPSRLAATRPRGRARAQADRAARSASAAWRAGDLDRARQFTGQAAELDPSRASLWQRHRAEINAKQVFLQAQEAHAAGDREHAQKLTEDAKRLDPRMRVVWNDHLTGVRETQHAPAPRGPAGPRHKPASTNGPVASHPRQPRNGTRTQWPPAANGTTRPNGPRPTRQEPGRPGTSGNTSRPVPREAVTGGRAALPRSHADAAKGEPQPGPGDRQQSAKPPKQPAPSRDPVQPPRAPESQHPAVSREHHPAAGSAPGGWDWRDTVIEAGRQSWQPPTPQPPDQSSPQPPQARGPEIGD